MRGTFPLCFGAWLVLAMPAQALDLHQAYVLSLAQDATVRAAQAAAAAGQERVPQARPAIPTGSTPAPATSPAPSATIPAATPP